MTTCLRFSFYRLQSLFFGWPSETKQTGLECNLIHHASRRLSSTGRAARIVRMVVSWRRVRILTSSFTQTAQLAKRFSVSGPIPALRASWALISFRKKLTELIEVFNSIEPFAKATSPQKLPTYIRSSRHFPFFSLVETREGKSLQSL